MINCGFAMTPVRKYKRQYNFKSRPHATNEAKDGVPGM